MTISIRCPDVCLCVFKLYKTVKHLAWPGNTKHLSLESALFQADI